MVVIHARDAHIVEIFLYNIRYFLKGRYVCKI